MYSGEHFQRVVELVSEQPWGGHADEIETSIMLAIDECCVDLSVAAPAPRRIERGLFKRKDSMSTNYSPDGVNGDPTLASKAKGQRLLDALLNDVLSAISDE